MAAKKALGELLVQENLISLTQLQQARKRQKEKGGRLTMALLNLGHVKEHELVSFLGNQYNLQSLDLYNFECEKEALDLVPEKVCRKNGVIPVSKAGKTLVVAFSDPSNVFVKDDLSLITQCKIQVVVSSESAIKDALDKYFGSENVNNFQNIMSDLADESELASVVEDGDGALLATAVDDAPIVKFVSAMLNDAILARASDIHIEPYETRFRIRFRVDGRLKEKTAPPKNVSNAVVSRLKIMCKMDISERRRPQDGRLKVRIKSGKEVDFRVNTVPTMFGEKMVLRLLDKSNLQLDMSRLGFEEEQLEVVLKAIHAPQGMVIITGPTGSGKTTTIYSCLAKLNQIDVNICTAEDPIEYNLDGINQVQVNSEIDFEFQDVLRAFLRQDPEIIMVGEIRDIQTANVAFKASSTGHLVVSTLHTNDAASTVSRLLDMGVPHFLVAESTSLVVAQRLLRKVCSTCIEEYSETIEALLEAGVPESQLDDYKIVYRGSGCESCSNSGYSGRIPVHETLLLTSKVKESIFNNASPLAIKKSAIEDGMLSLRQSALLKFKAGLTSLEEVVSGTVEDDLL